MDVWCDGVTLLDFDSNVVRLGNALSTLFLWRDINTVAMHLWKGKVGGWVGGTVGGGGRRRMHGNNFADTWPWRQSVPTI